MLCASLLVFCCIKIYEDMAGKLKVKFKVLVLGDACDYVSQLSLVLLCYILPCFTYYSTSVVNNIKRSTWCNFKILTSEHKAHIPNPSD